MKDTIGQRLQRERIARRLTLEQAAQATRIRSLYLQALENDDFAAMPSAVQGRGFLRLYAQYLGLDVEAILDEMRQAAAATAVSEITLLPEEPPLERPLLQRAWQGLLERLRTALFRPRAGASKSDEEPHPEAAPPPADQGESRLESEASPPGQGESPTKAEILPDPAPSEPDHPEHAESLSEDAHECLEESVSCSSEEIFAEIGSRLRDRRELLGLTLDEVEQHTRVRARYLQIIEAGRMDDLPSPVQTRGMLGNYASFLDLDPEELLLRFAEGLQARHSERQPEALSRRNGQKSGRLGGAQTKFLAGDLILGIVLIVSLFVFVFWAAARILAEQQLAEAEAEAPSISDVLLATPDETSATQMPTPTLILEGVAAPLQTATPTFAIPTITPLPPDLVQVTINVLERTFIRVRVDGETKFEDRVIPGTAYSFEGKDQVEVWTGSGAALQIIYNQRDQGRMGGFGEVVIRIYTRNAILTPTATTAPTATATQPPTSTPVPSPTPVSAQGED